MENHHKNEMDAAQRRYEQLKAERDKMERFLKEVRE